MSIITESDPKQWFKVDLLKTAGIADRYKTLVRTKDDKLMRIIWPGYVSPKSDMHIQHMSAIMVHVMVDANVTSRQSQDRKFKDYFYYFAVDAGKQLEYIPIKEEYLRGIAPPASLKETPLYNKTERDKGSGWHLPDIPYFLYHERLDMTLKNNPDNTRALLIKLNSKIIENTAEDKIRSAKIDSAVTSEDQNTSLRKPPQLPNMANPLTEDYVIDVEDTLPKDDDSSSEDEHPKAPDSQIAAELAADAVEGVGIENKSDSEAEDGEKPAQSQSPAGSDKEEEEEEKTSEPTESGSESEEEEKSDKSGSESESESEDDKKKESDIESEGETGGNESVRGSDPEESEVDKASESESESEKRKKQKAAEDAKKKDTKPSAKELVAIKLKEAEAEATKKEAEEALEAKKKKEAAIEAKKKKEAEAAAAEAKKKKEEAAAAKKKEEEAVAKKKKEEEIAAKKKKEEAPKKEEPQKKPSSSPSPSKPAADTPKKKEEAPVKKDSKPSTPTPSQTTAVVVKKPSAAPDAPKKEIKSPATPPPPAKPAHDTVKKEPTAKPKEKEHTAAPTAPSTGVKRKAEAPLPGVGMIKLDDWELPSAVSQPSESTKKPKKGLGNDVPVSSTKQNGTEKKSSSSSKPAEKRKAVAEPTEDGEDSGEDSGDDQSEKKGSNKKKKSAKYKWNKQTKRQQTDGNARKVFTRKTDVLRAKRESLAGKPGEFEAFLADDHPLSEKYSLSQRTQYVRDMLLWMHNMTLNTEGTRELSRDPLEGTCHPSEKDTGQYQTSFYNAMKALYYIAPDLTDLPHHDDKETDVAMEEI